MPRHTIRKRAVPEPGTCRICGCTEFNACHIEEPGGDIVPCGWADDSRTLCTNPACLEKAGLAVQKGGVA
jgi:hypothetical protein